MIIARQNKALAAIIDIDELQRLYELEEALDDYGVVQEFVAAEARGEIGWMTMEEIEALDRQPIAEANERATRRDRVARAADPAE